MAAPWWVWPERGFAMSWYHDRVLPHLVDRACGSRGLRAWRERVCAELTGRVVEIGFGSGHNLASLPDGVEELVAVEPSAEAWRLSQRRREACGTPVTLAGVDGQRLDLDDASCDAALCTFTLCTVPDPDAALGELWRVLRPGARLHVLEHGSSPDRRVARWQRRLDPLEQRLAGGCHLTRDPVALVHQAGFTTHWVEQAYGPGPKPWMWLTVGVFDR
jgi:ubiquinone/menaquinone biosynthesis C-methylase UbiE